MNRDFLNQLGKIFCQQILGKWLISLTYKELVQINDETPKAQ
jgi:hypothetical protein